MRKIRISAILLMVILGALVVFVAVVNLQSNSNNNPTEAQTASTVYPPYLYNGELISASEYLELVTQDAIAGCTMIPNASTYQGGVDTTRPLYACFDTEEALAAYMATTAPEWDRLATEYPQSPPPEVQTLDASHTDESE